MYMYVIWEQFVAKSHMKFNCILLLDIKPVTPNGNGTTFVQRLENLSACCGAASKYA